MRCNNLKRILFTFLITALLATSTGCMAKQRRDVELFNANTEATINLFNTTQDLYKGKEVEFIDALHKGTVNPEWLSEGFDYSEETALLKSNENHLISDEPLVSYAHFFTSLGANSVTQIIKFDLQGTSYLCEVLWVDTKIDLINLEVTSGVD